MNSMTINSTTTVDSNTSKRNNDFVQIIVGSIQAMARKARLIYTIYNERRALRDVSDETLKDMGISRADSLAEIDRSILDVPANRK